MLDLLSLGLLVILISLWLRWRAKKFSLFRELGIPGPPPNILFGNMMEMVRKNPTACFDEWTKKYGDVVGYYFGSWPVVLISNADHLKQVLIKDFGNFPDRPTDFLAFDGDNPNDPSSQHMINLKGQRWKEVRAMLTPSFTSGKLRQMLPFLEESTSVLLSKLEAASGNGKKDVEMFSLYQGLTMDVIGRSAFGIQTSVQENPNHPLLRFANMALGVRFNGALNVIFVCFRELTFLLLPLRKIISLIYGRGHDPVAQVFQTCADVVQLRRSNPSLRRPDLLQTVIDARSSEGEISNEALTASAEGTTQEEKSNTGGESKNYRRLNDIEVTANAFLFFIAGYETTSSTLAYVTHHLVNNPDVQDKVRQEILNTVGKDGPISYDDLNKLNYTERMVMEALRVHPPVFNFTNRVALKSFTLGKWTIPAGMTIQVPQSSIQMNPENFEDPEVFNPDRFLPENRGTNHSVTWLPFGAGPRNCVGMRFAMFEIKLTMAKILRKFELKPSKKTERDLKIRVNFAIIHPENGIHLHAVPI